MPPRHGCARAIAAYPMRPERDRLRVAKPLEWHLAMRQSEFVALVEVNCALQTQQQSEHELDALRVVVSKPAGKADYVMVG